MNVCIIDMIVSENVTNEVNVSPNTDDWTIWCNQKYVEFLWYVSYKIIQYVEWIPDLWTKSLLEQIKINLSIHTELTLE